MSQKQQVSKNSGKTTTTTTTEVKQPEVQAPAPQAPVTVVAPAQAAPRLNGYGYPLGIPRKGALGIALFAMMNRADILREGFKAGKYGKPGERKDDKGNDFYAAGWTHYVDSVAWVRVNLNKDGLHGATAPQKEQITKWLGEQAAFIAAAKQAAQAAAQAAAAAAVKQPEGTKAG